MVTLAPPKDADSGANTIPANEGKPLWSTIIWLSILTVMAGWAVVRLIGGDKPSPDVIWWACGMWLTTGLGVTVGYHRFGTHAGFKTFKWFKFVLLFLGGAAIEGAFAGWCRTHLAHHANNDRPRRSPGDAHDPHTPYQFARSAPLQKRAVSAWNFWARLRQYEFVREIQVQRGRTSPIRTEKIYLTIGEYVHGGWYAHMGWMLKHTVLPAPFETQGPRDAVERWQHKYYLVPAIASFVVPWAATGFKLDGLLIAGFLRVFVLAHSTASINSVCHIFGTQLADPRAQARTRHSGNVWWLWILSLGECFHNMHHALQSCVAHGWGFLPDISKWFIWLLEKAHLIYDVKWMKEDRREILDYRPPTAATSDMETGAA